MFTLITTKLNLASSRRLDSNAPIRDLKAGIRHCNAWSHNDPLSLFTRDDRDVHGADSHMRPHDCGQEKKTAVLWNGAQLTLRQLRQEMGVGVGSWRPNSAIWGFCISHNPLCTHPLLLSHTHTPNAPHLLVFYPLEVRVWYQPICFNHPHNPNTGLTSTTPEPHSCFPFLPSVCHRRATATPKHTRKRERRTRGVTRKG